MSLKDYLDSKDRLPALASVHKTVESGVRLVTAGSLGDLKSTEFASKVAALVRSDEFEVQLSDVVGEPTAEETEEEFIERAKQSMKALLTSKLK